MNKNPYPGLRAFEYTENHLFFGREGQEKEIAKRLEENQFVAVVGSSGSGKSSLVRAGLLPLLYGGRKFAGARWKIAIMRPGDTPIRNLASALVNPEDFELFDEEEEKLSNKNTVEPKDKNQVYNVETILRRSGVGLSDFINTAKLEEDENILIVVDQFEELFRFEKKREDQADEAAAFVRLLLEATHEQQEQSENENAPKKKNPIYVVMTMRSDFLGNCAEFRELPEAINDGQYLIPRMTRKNLRSSIESPAEVFDAKISPVLVNHLLNKLEDKYDPSLDSQERMMQDQLPVLQHALMQTWDEWDSRKTRDEPLDTEHYKAIGEMQDALSIHANKAFDELDDEQKVIAEKMFKCLTEKDKENRETRRPASISEICAVTETEEADILPVIEVFRREGRTFLMPPPSIEITEKTKIDISHESLIRRWDKLRKWVDKEAEDAEEYCRISEHANRWFYNLDEDGERETDYLFRGRVATDAYEWWNNVEPTLGWAKRHQPITKKENADLALSSQFSPDKESQKRKQLFENRFNEAEEFLNRSYQYDLAEEQKEKRLLRKRFITSAVLAAVFLLLAGLAGFSAYLSYTYSKSLESQKAQLKVTNDLLIIQKENLKQAQKKLEQSNKQLKLSYENLEQQQKKIRRAKKRIRRSYNKRTKTK